MSRSRKSKMCRGNCKFCKQFTICCIHRVPGARKAKPSDARRMQGGTGDAAQR